MAKDRAAEIREQAEQDYMNGMKYIDLAEKYGVTLNTIKSWKQRYKWDRKGVHTKGEKCAHKKDKRQYAEQNINEIDTALTDKQRLFAEIYVRNFNATQAAIKAGYSPDTAFVQGSRLLSNAKVRKYVNYLKELKKQAIMLNEDDVVERYMRIAFADMTDFVNFGQQDMPIMTSDGPVYEIDPKTGQRIILTQRTNTMRIKEDYEVDGGLICEIKIGKQGTSLKLEDRQKALDWLANHMDLLDTATKQKLDIERGKLALETAKANIGMDDDDETGVVVLPDEDNDLQEGGRNDASTKQKG